MTRDSKKYHPFPILIMAERVSSLVSNSSKPVQVFPLELANFQAELPIQISFNFNTFSLVLKLWKQLQAASFPGSPSQEGCKFLFPGTTIPRRQFIFSQTRNQGLLGLLHLSKGFLLPWPRKGWVKQGSRRWMWWGARHPAHHSSCPVTALCSQGRASEVNAWEHCFHFHRTTPYPAKVVIKGLVGIKLSFLGTGWEC